MWRSIVGDHSAVSLLWCQIGEWSATRAKVEDDFSHHVSRGVLCVKVSAIYGDSKMCTCGSGYDPKCPTCGKDTD